MPDKINVRFVTLSTGAVYLRQEDVIAIIQDAGSSEETDVRNRLDQLADNLSTVGTKRGKTNL